MSSHDGTRRAFLGTIRRRLHRQCDTFVECALLFQGLRSLEAQRASCFYIPTRSRYDAALRIAAPHGSGGAGFAIRLWCLGSGTRGESGASGPSAGGANRHAHRNREVTGRYSARRDPRHRSRARRPRTADSYDRGVSTLDRAGPRCTSPRCTGHDGPRPRGGGAALSMATRTPRASSRDSWELTSRPASAIPASGARTTTRRRCRR